MDARRTLAKELRIPLSELTYILYKKKPDNYYISFTIPKKNGGSRIIYAPQGKLKVIQSKLVTFLYIHHMDFVKQNKIQCLISHGFEKRKSIITNAEKHINKKIIVNVDIKDFFDSFHFGRVSGFFEKSKEFAFSREVAILIAQLSCYKGKLPQGAPTSPVISNLIFNIVDMKILSLTKKYKLSYTRYADDLTFSTNNMKFIEVYKEFIIDLEKLLGLNGFKVKEAKTRIASYKEKQVVTGLTVNKKVNTNKKYYKQTRSMVDALFTKGEFEIDGLKGTLAQLEGRLSFINNIDWYNNKKSHKFEKRTNNPPSQNLNAREKVYQKFLFYKYFYSPLKPTIVTEGKTDILYIKSALKKNYTNYPELIEKKNNSFYYKIYFLNKSNRTKFFFNIVEGGASLTTLFSFYVGKSNNEDLYSYIFDKDKNKKVNKNPVFLLFDNEKSSGKPLMKLRNLLSECKISFSDSICNSLIGNLFVLVHPLPEDKKNFNKNLDYEIEDLFDDDVLNTGIYGKKFIKISSNKSSEDTYSKDRFANYVYNNYENINFDRFIPLLDEIKATISNINK